MPKNSPEGDLIPDGNVDWCNFRLEMIREQNEETER